MEILNKVQPVLVELHCDNCGNKAEVANQVNMSYPPQYNYFCSDKTCDWKHTSINNYPYIKYELVKN